MGAGTGVSDLGPSASLRNASGTATKMVALVVAQGGVYAFPLVFAVVCARNLGPSQYGVISFYTALASFLCTFIEFGFDSIGVREVHASARPGHPQQVMWNVTLAKLLVCLPTCGLALAVLLAMRSPAERSIACAMVLYMIAFAIEPSWYLRSLELMRSVMLVAVVSRFAGIVLLVSVVTSHSDVAVAMWTYAFVAWASVVVGWLLMRHLGVVGRPSIDVPHLRALFRSGAAIVLGNLSGSSLTSAGVAVLGAISDPVVTGAANLAVRIRSAGVAAMVPLSQLGFVRLSTLKSIDTAAAVAHGRRLFYTLMASSAVLAIIIILEADRITALAYGLPTAPHAAGVLVRLLAVGLPAYVAAGLFGVQGLTLFRQERAYVIVSLGAAVVFFGLLLSLNASSSASFGWALLAADSWLALAAGLRLWHTVKVHATH